MLDQLQCVVDLIRGIGERSMRQAFQGFLALFGVIVIGISLAHLAIGPEAIIGGADVNPTSDGEDRFFAGLLLCYGVALLWCARDVQDKRDTSMSWPPRSSWAASDDFWP
jgi:Domain of unknown function (DUF4345)